MKTFTLLIMLMLACFSQMTGQSITTNNPADLQGKQISAISNALDFDGIEDYVAISNGTALISGLEEFSMCGWVYATNANAAWPDFDGYFGIKDEGICDFYIAQINGVGIEARITTSVGQYTINPDEIPEAEIDEWHHYALVYTGEQLEIYFDGALEGFVDAEGTIDFTDKELTLGKLEYFDSDFYLDGKLDEVTIWNKALTEDDLQDLLCISGDPGGIDGLVAYYDFNEEDGFVLPDYFGNYDGVLIGMTGDEWVASEVCESGYDITFTVTDEATTLPVEGAEIICDGVTKTTDNNGQAVFSNYDPGTYSWEVTMDDYYDASGEVEVIDQDVEVQVALAPVVYYSITFIVTEDPGSIPIDSAIVNMDGLLQYTDETGTTTFTGYLPGSYTYNVSKSGYFLVPGTAVVVDEDLTIEVSMTLVGMDEYPDGSVKIFPNPGTNELFIVLNEPQGQELIELISLSGRVVAEASPEGNTVHLPADMLDKGIYFIKITSSTGVSLYKWVKQ